MTYDYLINEGYLLKTWFICFIRIVTSFCAFRMQTMILLLLFFSGKNLNTLDVKNAVRTCGFAYSGNLIMYSTDKTMGHPCEIHIFDVSDPSQMSKWNIQYCYPDVRELCKNIVHHSWTKFCNMIGKWSMQFYE